MPFSNKVVVPTRGFSRVFKSVCIYIYITNELNINLFDALTITRDKLFIVVIVNANTEKEKKKKQNSLVVPPFEYDAHYAQMAFHKNHYNLCHRRR